MIVEQDIKEAFWQLLEEKPYNKISVNDIVHRCGIHRNTFYYHFENIPDLIRKMSLDWIDEIVKENTDTAARLMPYYAPLIPRALKHKKKIMNIYRAVDHDIATDFIRKMADYAAGRYFEGSHFDPPLNDEDLRLMRHYGRNLFTGVLIDWLDADMNFDLMQLINRSQQLLFGGKEEKPLYYPVLSDEAEESIT